MPGAACPPQMRQYPEMQPLAEWASEEMESVATAGTALLEAAAARAQREPVEEMEDPAGQEAMPAQAA